MVHDGSERFLKNLSPSLRFVTLRLTACRPSPPNVAARLRKASVGDALDSCVAPASATTTLERREKASRAPLGAALAVGGMSPPRWSLEPSEPVPRGARGLTADGVLPNSPRFKLGRSAHAVKPSALRRTTGSDGRAGGADLRRREGQGRSDLGARAARDGVSRFRGRQFAGEVAKLAPHALARSIQ